MTASHRRRHPELPLDDYRREARCETCKLTPHLCVCDETPRLDVPLRFTIIQHIEEIHSQSNTGTITHRTLPGSRRLVHGSREAPLEASLWDDPEREFCVLFPVPGAPPVSPEVPRVRPGRELDVVVLDATWKQARRMSRRIPGLPALPFVTLPDRPRASLLLRKPDPRREGQLSTGEAIAGVLRARGHVEESDRLEAFLKKVASRILHIRGKLGRADVTDIPNSLSVKRETPR